MMQDQSKNRTNILSTEDTASNMQYYETIAPIFDFFYASKNYSKEVECFDAIFRDESNKGPIKRILDVGCATGARTSMLQQLGWDIAGLENAPSMCRKAKEKHPSISVVRGSVLEIPDLPIWDIDIVLLASGVPIFATTQKDLRTWFQVIHTLNPRLLIIDMPNVSNETLLSRAGFSSSLSYEDENILIFTQATEKVEERRVVSKRSHIVTEKRTQKQTAYEGTLTMHYHTPLEIKTALDGIFKITNTLTGYQSQSYSGTVFPSRYISLASRV